MINTPSLEIPETIRNLSHERSEIEHDTVLTNTQIPINMPPPRPRELDNHQEVKKPLINSVTPINITIENVLNSTIAREDLPPPEPAPINQPAPIASINELAPIN